MEPTEKTDIPKTAFVIFNSGAFGGAPVRDTNLFLHLSKLYPGKFYFFVNRHLYNQLHEVYKNLPEEYIRIIDIEWETGNKKSVQKDIPRYYKDTIPDPMEVDKQHTIFRKLYWFTKNKNRQRKLFRQIEKLREELDIKVFYGVFAGVLPLVFYLKESPRRAHIIFSEMDSWFTDVHADMKKLWYRKYYSFNYALENCNIIDFLSPYIVDGVKKLGVNLKEESIHVSPCSFIDYSKCSIGEKRNIGIAFGSRMEPDKNPMLYLEAAKEIIKKFPNVKFHILGEGTLVNEIKEFIDLNNLSSSINFQFHKNPPEIYKETSIFVSLQTHTNYPSQSLLEAMACGNAVIASNRGDTELIINKHNGLLIDLKKDELIAILEKLINDPALTKELGKNGREFVLKNHTIDKFTEYFLGMLKKVYT